jgi:hypothetical protein
LKAILPFVPGGVAAAGVAKTTVIARTSVATVAHLRDRRFLVI